MKTIQTKPDCTLGFVKDSGPIQDIHLVQDILSKHILIGKLSEITEEQAKELVNYMPVAIPHPDSQTITCDRIYKDYLNGGGSKDAKHSLETLALSVGIEEKDFDKYLVVKL